MKTMRIKTEDIKHDWYLIDAENKILGRLATQIATILMGKKKVTYQRDIDNGDCVIVLNASKVAVTGRKMEDKKYYKHSGSIGNLKEKNLEEMLAKKPEDVLMLAVKRMLPKNKLGSAMLTRLRVYRGSSHPHTAQKPIVIK